MAMLVHVDWFFDIQGRGRDQIGSLKIDKDKASGRGGFTKALFLSSWVYFSEKAPLYFSCSKGGQVHLGEGFLDLLFCYFQCLVTDRNVFAVIRQGIILSLFLFTLFAICRGY